MEPDPLNRASAKNVSRRSLRDTFLPWAETNLARGTYRSYKWRSEDLCQAFGEVEISEISTFAVEKFKREQLKRRTKRGNLQTPTSVNRYLWQDKSSSSSKKRRHEAEKEKGSRRLTRLEP